MHQRLFHLTLFIFLSLLVSGQDYLDSLLNNLDTAREDSTRIRLLLDISTFLYLYDPAEATKYADQSLMLAQKIGDKEGIADSYYNLGVINKNKGRYEQALDFFTKCQAIYEEINDKNGLARATNGFGQLWYLIEDYPKALEYFRACNALFIQLNDTLNIATTYLNIGSVLGLLGDHDQALEYIFKARDIFEIIRDERRLASTYLNIGEHYEYEGDLTIAEEYYRRGLSLSKKINAKPRISDSYWYLGKFYYTINENQLAINYFDSAFTVAKELESIESQRDDAWYLSKLYKRDGDLENALYFSELYNVLNDSIKKAELNEQLSKIEWERERELEKQLEEKETQRQRLMKNFALIAVILMVIIVAVLFRSYRIKQKSNKLLAEIDQLKSRMFSNISHEFRTPLTLILGPVEEMLQQESGKAKTTKNLKLVQRNASRLLALVNQVLELSKMDAGMLKLSLVEDDIVQAVQVMILTFSSKAEQKKIKYTYDVPEQGCVTYFDSDKTEKILNNLLSNALKFTPEGGQIHVSLTVDTGTRKPEQSKIPRKSVVMTLSVEDTGRGIPKDQLGKVFDRFHQVEGMHDPDRIGTGIGLSLIKELVELMHGQVTVDSMVGKGSKFTVRLPLGTDHLNDSEFELVDTKPSVHHLDERIAEPEDVEFTEMDQDEEDETDNGKPLILIVEDHAEIRSHISDNMPDYRILEAPDGKAGLEIAIEQIPDLIITDLMMPEMDGVEMCSLVKTDEKTSHIPVVMLTAKASVEDRIEGFETGADDYITKPFNVKELNIRVNNLIEQRKKLRERFSRELDIGLKEIAVNSADERFLNKVIELIEENIRDDTFDVAVLSKEMAMSRMQLYRKIKALTDQSPSDFLRTMRLKRAAHLIRNKFGNIAEVCYEVGINHLSHFAKNFKDLYGVSPSEYAKNH